MLDVGCGPGTITADLAERVAPGSVVGVDRSAEVIDQATDAHRASDLEFRIADVMALPFGDDSFDVVHAHQVLQHVPDPVGALVEMRRVCRPGGVVAVRDSDYGAFTWAPADPTLDRWLELYRDDRPAQRRRARCRSPPAGMAARRRLLRRAAGCVGLVLRDTRRSPPGGVGCGRTA